MGESMFVVKSIHHRFLLDPQKLAVCHGRCRSHAESLARQRAFAKETLLVQYADGGFLASLRYDREPHFAFLNIEDSVRRIPLSENPFLPANSEALPALAYGRKEAVKVEYATLLGCRSRAHSIRL